MHHCDFETKNSSGIYDCCPNFWNADGLSLNYWIQIKHIYICLLSNLFYNLKYDISLENPALINSRLQYSYKIETKRHKFWDLFYKK